MVDLNRSVSAAILVPSFNSSATLGETLKSLLLQKDLASVRAVYLADDGSSDDSIELARRSWTGPPLRVIARAHNIGQWPNVNGALREIAGEAEWICILHADDMAKPEWLSEIFACIRTAHDTVASICSSWDNLQHDGTIAPGENNRARGPVQVSGNGESVRSTLLRGCWWHISGCAIRTAAFVDTGDFSLHYPYMGDWDWLLRSLSRGWEVVYIPQSLIVYRLQTASVAGRAFQSHLDISESIDILKKHAGYLSVGDLMRLHLTRIVTLMRRLAASVVRFHGTRALKAIGLLLFLPWHAASCVFAHARQSGSRHYAGH